MGSGEGAKDTPPGLAGRDQGKKSPRQQAICHRVSYKMIYRSAFLRLQVGSPLGGG